MSGSLFQTFYGNDVAGAAALLSKSGPQTGPTTIAPTKDSTGIKLSKQDINKRDARGRTVLHLAASSGSLEFAKVLLANPATDVNLLDTESGWTALHRALYNGRIACAQYIIAERGQETIKVKDRESNSPFDVLNSTLNGTNPPQLTKEKGGSDLFTFGSNKNNTLGFGDGDDRSHPEKVHIIRPGGNDETPLSKFRPSRIRDVQMAKMHTAILTTDDRDNLYICGFNGNFARLGLSASQSTGTQFVPKPVHGIGDPVASVALGQDHTIVVTKAGAVYTWGSNHHGQLGYVLDSSVNKDNVQKVPRKIVSTLKRIEILGVAASAFHSVCFSKEDLYTWGLNRGQLGYSSGDDGPIQSTPKKVATLQAPIEMVTAINNATICLLKNKTVSVFANGGHTRVVFQLECFADNFAGVSLSSVFRPRQMYTPNIITKIASGGSTVCAVSSMGDVFSFSLPDSATNPQSAESHKSIKATQIWSLRRRHMAVRDVAVGQDGTVIISTESGSVWTRIRRAKPKISKSEGSKEFKFARVPNLTRVVAVRANNVGAYAAIRNDVEMKDTEITPSSLGRDLIAGIPLGELVEKLDGDKKESLDMSSQDEGAESRNRDSRRGFRYWKELLMELPQPSELCDVALVTREGYRLYLHKAMLACRSPGFRDFLQNPGSKEFEVNTVDGVLEVQIGDVGMLAAAHLLYYIYTDKLLDLPERTNVIEREQVEIIQHLRRLTAKFRLDLFSDALVSSWYILNPQESLQNSLRTLQTLSPALATPDAILCLADTEVACHSFILAARCPFFEAMMDNAGLGGGWIATRRLEALAEGTSEFRIQLKHLSYTSMSLVLEHIYCDTGIELFDQVRKETSEEFLEYVIEIMAVANELLLDRLKDICQSILSRFVTLRNVATILEEADTYNAEKLKDACLDYCTINADALLENRLLDDLNPDIMSDLEARIREKQIERLPISRGEVLLRDLSARYPNLEYDIEEEHEARQFISTLSTSFSSPYGTTSVPSPLIESKYPTSKPPTAKKGKRNVRSATNSPILQPSSDLIFDMDDDLDVNQGSPSVKHIRPAEQAKNPWRDVNGKPLKEQPPIFSPNQKFRIMPQSISTYVNGHEGWSEVKASGRSKREAGAKSVEITSISQQTTPKSSQSRPTSTLQSSPVPLTSPSFSTPASPWKKPDTSPSIPFATLQREQANQVLSSTFPPSTHSSLPERPRQPISSNVPPQTSPGPVLNRRNPTTPTTSSTTHAQIRSVPGKSFQQKQASPPPVMPDMFPALGSPPQRLVDIIAQQTSEQKALNTKIAPRSLKEIQEEEQFLQWWEQECQRVKEEELLSRTTAIPVKDVRGRAQRGRGGRRIGTPRGRGGQQGRGRGELREDIGKEHVQNRNK